MHRISLRATSLSDKAARIDEQRGGIVLASHLRARMTTKDLEEAVTMIGEMTGEMTDGIVAMIGMAMADDVRDHHRETLAIVQTNDLTSQLLKSIERLHLGARDMARRPSARRSGMQEPFLYSSWPKDYEPRS